MYVVGTGQLDYIERSMAILNEKDWTSWRNGFYEKFKPFKINILCNPSCVAGQKQGAWNSAISHCLWNGPFLGYIIRGGITCPLADMHTTTVCVLPFSPHVSEYTCFLTTAEKTLPGLCTTHIPVSSTL